MGKFCLLLVGTLLPAIWTHLLGGVNSVTIDEEQADYEDDLPPSVISHLRNSPGDDGVPDATPKIFGGTTANLGDFPHQVSVQKKSKLRDGSIRHDHFCGASIIHPYLLLSAAHCFFERYTAEQVRVQAGVHEILTARSPPDAGQVRNVTKIFIHPAYNGATWNNDIAILVLNESLQFKDYVKPIKLRDPTWKLPGSANVTGWGITQKGRTSDALQMAQVPIIQDHQLCTEKVENVSKEIFESMMCAGDRNGDSCGGDSGGPLTCLRDGTNGQVEPYLCGVVSWGLPCGRSVHLHVPGVYTDVAKYTGWISKFTSTWWKYYWVTKLCQPPAEGKNCETKEFYCPSNGLCIPKELTCDGKYDCDPLGVDKSDEQNCTVISCVEGDFQCNSKCINESYVCDGEADCEDRSDELGC